MHEFTLTDRAAELVCMARQPMAGSAYCKLYFAILDGKLPAERDPAGQWTVLIPDAARVLDINLRAAAYND